MGGHRGDDRTLRVGGHVAEDIPAGKEVFHLDRGSVKGAVFVETEFERRLASHLPAQESPGTVVGIRVDVQPDRHIRPAFLEGAVHEA